MSRPRKMHRPIKGSFNEILAAALMGGGRGKRAAIELQRNPIQRPVHGEKVPAVQAPAKKP